MRVDKLSVSFDPQLAEAIRAAAGHHGQPVSTWLAEAAASKLRAEALTAYLDAWEAEHGALSRAELAAAESSLGLSPAGPSAA